VFGRWSDAKEHAGKDNRIRRSAVRTPLAARDREATGEALGVAILFGTVRLQ